MPAHGCHLTLMLSFIFRRAQKMYSRWMLKLPISTFDRALVIKMSSHQPQHFLRPGFQAPNLQGMQKRLLHFLTGETIEI